METLHEHVEELPQNSPSDFDTEGQENLTENEHIAAQIEKLESKFDRNPDGSDRWGRFVDSPVRDQYGQIWMIWENPAASSSIPKDRYQIYKILNDEDEFRYAFIKELEVDRYPGYHKTSYEFFVGPDDGRDETITVFFNDDGVIEYVHCYSYLEERKRLYEKYERAQKKLAEASIINSLTIAA
ncbi:hypothetical protein LRM41_00100 [Candidatus Nanosynbacter sp. TM7-087]|uniref:hypothetical protein n=1 Tax=Candidatus Nanosynbacter sp. TM7-087 TaxID=2902631 RepID=UPI001FB6E3B7|nr:hypothetical protein [Candidatus Nanosynbacter sp. TM7-087]MCJ1965984.1 hypothetical protein [Candidatus Nanosynbacter sp. TM7-087]